MRATPRPEAQQNLPEKRSVPDVSRAIAVRSMQVIAARVAFLE